MGHPSEPLACMVSRNDGCVPGFFDRDIHWWAHEAGDPQALPRLLRYCRQDVESLVVIAPRIYRRLARRSAALETGWVRRQEEIEAASSSESERCANAGSVSSVLRFSESEDDVSVPSAQASSQEATAWRSSSASSCVAEAVVMGNSEADAGRARQW